jgi:hypothetical protein
MFLVLAACGNQPAATGQASSSPLAPSGSPAASPSSSASASHATFPSPSPSGPNHLPPLAATCTSKIPAGHALALVTLRSTAGVAVRDISDLSKPVTRCVISGVMGNFLRFVNTTRISYIETANNGDGAMYVADLGTGATSLIRSWSNGGSLYWIYAWSPDGTTLSYLSSDGDQVAWHLRSSAGDVTLSRLGSVPGRGVDGNNDDAMVGFSADGKYVALENTFTTQTPAAPRFQIVRLSDHKLVYSRTDGTMATWAGTGASLYFRTTLGVLAWNPTSGARVVVPQGFRWIRPSPSADGKRIVYEDADGAGNHFAGYLRLADNQAFRLSQLPRTGSVFLTPTLMWYAGESVCSATVQCGLGGPPLTGRTYVRDLVTGTESASIITAVFDSWPHVVAS